MSETAMCEHEAPLFDCEQCAWQAEGRGDPEVQDES